MLFKRAPKNRRLARSFVLDVKLRSSQVRAKRMRMIAVLLGGLFAALACVLLAWRATQWSLSVLLYGNKAFAIRQLDIQTDGVISPDQLRRWTGVQLGQNLFALDLASVRRNLELVSAIRSVSLEKVLPRTLRVRVVEREPVAQLSVPRPTPTGGVQFVSYYLDSDGYVVTPLSPAQCSAGSVGSVSEPLPTIIGLRPNDVQPGRPIDSQEVRAALELVQAFERSTLPGWVDLKTIDVSGHDVLHAKTEQGSQITFSLGDLDQQVLRWQAIFETGQRMNKAIAELDLAVTNSIPVTWVDSVPAPLSPAKPAKLLRNRKKHV